VTIPLQVQSCFSLLEALPTPADLAHAAAQTGLPALALTDHRCLSGAVEFYQACLKESVKPLLGLLIDVLPPGAPRGRAPKTAVLLLLAMDRAGWANLCRLSSAINLEEHPAPCTWDALSGCAGGLIALADDLGDPTGGALAALAELFPGRCYTALRWSDPADTFRIAQTARLAADLHLPTAALSPVTCLERSQAPLLATLAAIRIGCSLTSLPAEARPPAEPNLAGPREMAERFSAYPQALAATREIAERCNLALPLGEPHYPRIAIPEGQTPAGLLRQKAEAGAQKLYGAITPALRVQLDKELEVIAGRGFEPVFLIMEEIIRYARQAGVPVSSRGSAGSSLVAHCLGITSPDPLRLNLYFERFLNPARSSPPDIDTDLCSRRRDGVIQHVFETYGAEHVAMVGTINRFRPRSALGEVAKAYGLPAAQMRELVETLPYRFFGGRDAETEEEVPESPFKALCAAYPRAPFPQIFQDAEALLRLPRHLSVHPGGVVIAPGPLTDLVPLMRSGNKGVTITQLDLDALASLGLIKLDLLGIRGLTVLGDVAEAVYSWRRKEFHTPLEVLDAIPGDDPETADRIERGDTIGCFQIESPGMRATLREIHAREPDDLMIALALYRPGPLKGGLKDAFVRRFKGEEEVTHLHPDLAPLLEETCGVILYQEQVLRIAHDLAGLSLADADLLRRAMSHFDPGRQMQVLRDKFIDGAQQHCGIDAELAGRIWEMMAAFAGYGFPKAHAASYAQVSWNAAWCKSHFPAEFMAAVLANWGGYYSQRVYLTEARRMGLALRPPSVNHSRAEFSVSYAEGQPVLYMGLDQVRDLTRRAQERILRGRPFRSLDDFLTRIDPSKAEAENLIRAGAFEGLGAIPGLLARLKEGPWQLGQMSLFGWKPEEGEEWSLSERMAAQEDVLGISVDAHPLELYAGQIAAAGALSTLEAAAHTGVSVAGVRMAWRRSRAEKGGMMAFLTLEDLEGMLEVVIYPDVYRRIPDHLGASEPLLVRGVIETDPGRGEPLLRAERVERLAGRKQA
jgi:DNA-directed DNA polymerase III PolC